MAGRKRSIAGLSYDDSSAIEKPCDHPGWLSQRNQRLRAAFEGLGYEQTAAV